MIRIHHTIGAFIIAASLAGCDKAAEASAKNEPAAASIAPAKAEPAKAEPAKAEPTKAAEPAKADPVKVAAAEEIDVDDLLDAPNAAGIASVELDPAALAEAPRLGATASNNAAIKDADWLGIPGGTLEVPNPKSWTRKRDDTSGYLISPDQKIAIVFTTFTDMKQVETKLDEIGKATKINKVQWKEPKQVKLGVDNLASVVRGGDVTTEQGLQGELIFALVETGKPDKVLAVALVQNDAKKEDQDIGKAVFLSVRNRRVAPQP